MFRAKLRFSAIRNSGTFYFGGAGNLDWTDPQNNSLWLDAVKTLSDPCPAGWRVPLSGTGQRSPWSALTKDNGPWEGTTTTTGRKWSGFGNVWYPASGFRDSRIGGNIGTATVYGHVWSSHLDESQYWLLRFDVKMVDDGSEMDNANRYLDFGLSVRCIRE